MRLYKYGMKEQIDYLKEKIEDGKILARIAAEHKSNYRLITECGEYIGELSGKFIYNNIYNEDKPTVGDYCKVSLSDYDDKAIIYEVMERKNLIYRADSFRGGKQLLVSNVDIAFVCMSLNYDFNETRLERYLMLLGECGANTIIVLTKSDLLSEEELNIKIEICKAICGNIPVVCISNVNKKGYEELDNYLEKGKTIVAIGSSGVGKSTLVNNLSNKNIMETKEISSYEKGRHTTVHRQMILLSNGCIYIDTPGIREVGLVDNENSVNNYFDKIEELKGNCKYSNCTHQDEVGCAIREGIKNNIITEKEYNMYKKYLKELEIGKIKEHLRNSRATRKDKYKRNVKSLKAMNINRGDNYF